MLIYLFQDGIIMRFYLKSKGHEVTDLPNCASSFDINNNMSAELKKTFVGGGAMGDRRGSALGDMPLDSEG